MKELQEFTRTMQKLERVYKTLPTTVGKVAVNFSKERFVQGNWVDHTTQPWKKRKYEKARNKGRAVLVQSARLKRSIRVISKSLDRVVVGTDVSYAQVHNEGFRGKVSQSVKARRIKGYRRKAHFRKGKHIGATTVGTHDRKAHTRTIHQNIPKRQFMGKSAVLEQRINRTILAQINKTLK